MVVIEHSRSSDWLWHGKLETNLSLIRRFLFPRAFSSSGLIQEQALSLGWMMLFYRIIDRRSRAARIRRSRLWVAGGDSSHPAAFDELKSKAPWEETRGVYKKVTEFGLLPYVRLLESQRFVKSSEFDV